MSAPFQVGFAPIWRQGQAADTDPHGIDQHAPGAKLDAGKQRPALVLGEFANALQTVVEVGTYGAAKYSPSGWLSVPDGEARYLDAAMRHLLAMFGGEALDQESGIEHLAHATWNLLAVAELRERGEE